MTELSFINKIERTHTHFKTLNCNRKESVIMFIDIHVHIGNSLNFPMNEELVIEMIKKYNIDYCIVSNSDSVEYGHDLSPIPGSEQVSQADSFRRSIRFARESEVKGKVFIMPWIKPATETVDDEFEGLVKENLDIVKGLKIHSYHSKTALDDECVEPYLELAEKYNLPFLIHTGGCEEADAIHVYNVAVKYPDINFIMGHMNLGTDNKSAIDLMDKAKNLYADTAWVPVESTIEIIRRYGSKRIMFGSDSPIDGAYTYEFNRSGEPSMYRRYFNGLEEIIGKEQYADLMYRNAMDFFKIK